ncbi:YeiH family protein [Paenibacillus piri]|uniref:YeiH family putative sulfate export transporter n=1 Tax=Paenibacillus piri TaxID=2547395 RepID=A0A4R5KQL5_9BACL|nr:YeiH family protein [Paenibacillus piri]TDF98049.1 YeiH family putative sulfate export transporter [Paenibacillus piri]
MTWIRNTVPGIVFVLMISLVAAWAGSIFPLIGGAVFGLLSGFLINNITGKPKYTYKGILFSSKKVLQWAVIGLGFSLSLSQVWNTGVESFYIMAVTLLAAIAASYGFGKLLSIPDRLNVLIGVGTGICGGSAIAAVSPVIKANEVEVAYSVSTIFLFNVAAVILFPLLGHWLGLSDKAFGLLAGTAINDTSSVVTAGYIYSQAAGDYATVVKLARTTMIIPVTFLLSALVGMKAKREEHGQQNVHYSITPIFPWFIVWFLAASLFNTLGLFGEGTIHYAGMIAKFMIVMALTAIGLSADFRKMIKTGFRPIVLGFIVWIAVILTSVILLWASGQL